MQKQSVTFFTSKFPVLSQTFVVQQINGLIALGHPVNIVSIQPGDRDFINDPSILENDLLNKTTYLLSRSIPIKNPIKCIINIIYKQVLLLFTKPKHYSLALFSLALIRQKNLQVAVDILNIGLSDIKCPNTSVVIAHFGHVGVIAHYLQKSKILSGRLFTFFHGYEISEYKQIKRWKYFYTNLADKSELLLPISELWKKRLLEYGVPKSKVAVHHMGINPYQLEFKNRPICPHLSILTVARATEKKGIKYALEAIENTVSPLTYNIIGGGKLLDELKYQVKNYKRKNDIVFHGSKPPEFILQSLKQADIFLLPSVTDKDGDMEGIPVSLMEAMASGVITISTIHSGIPELIESDVSGFLVPEKDPKSITQVIDAISNEQYDLKKIRHAALTTIMTNFNTVLLNKKLSERICKLP